MTDHFRILFALGLVTSSACASTPGAKPADMSAAGHEQAGAAHEAQAASHAAAYDPAADEVQKHCPPGAGRPCWTSIANPTAAHEQEAERHRKMAADHRAAARALRTAEAQSCGGLSDDDRDISPFDHREDISGVSAATELVPPSGKSQHSQLVGATVTFRAVPGLTAEWLQRIVDCHIARNAALGNELPEMPYCPLVPKGVSARVSSTGNGFAVTIQSSDSRTAEEILRRAQSLRTGS